jgi:transcriptional regulator with XRE-family HTH domain
LPKQWQYVLKVIQPLPLGGFYPSICAENKKAPPVRLGGRRERGRAASLATQSGVDASHLEGFERGRRRLSVLDLSVIQRALEAAGVEFSAENGGGAGVRLRKAE